jgi:hypothetical protein
MLEWERCPDGVEIIDLGPAPKTDLGKTKLPEPHGLWLRARSARRVPVVYEMRDLERPVVLHFLNARSLDDMIAFHGRFGMRGSADTASLDQCFQERDNLANFLACSTASQIGEATEIVNTVLSTVRLRPTVDFAGSGKMPNITLHPASLWQFMAMEVATAASCGAELAQCENCGKLFLTGSLTGRRSHAKYCSDRCRVAAMRKRNAAK